MRIGDPSGRTTARDAQAPAAQFAYIQLMRYQLRKIWPKVVALGDKHFFPYNVSRRATFSDNHEWLEHIRAIDLMQSLGSGMRLAAMLNRDS